MQKVTMKVTTMEEYKKALEYLDRLDYIAEMADDFTAWKREKNAVARKYAELTENAKKAGLI